jgi:hypothetical protein
MLVQPVVFPDEAARSGSHGDINLVRGLPALDLAE